MIFSDNQLNFSTEQSQPTSTNYAEFIILTSHILLTVDLIFFLLRKLKQAMCSLQFITLMNLLIVCIQSI